MVAHHTLEPMNCVAQVAATRWKSGLPPRCPVPLPEPERMTSINTSVSHLDNIKLHSTFIGGGLGRRLNVDYVIEAVGIAKNVSQPVKVLWSREDTTELGPYRPMTFSKLKGGFSEDGKLISFEHKVISPSFREAMTPGFDIKKVDGTMVEGIGEQAYEIPNLKTSYVRADFHVPVAAWRSVTSSTLAFCHECFIDELAYKANTGSAEFPAGIAFQTIRYQTGAVENKRIFTLG